MRVLVTGASVYDARRAVAALGWRPRHGWRSVLDEASPPYQS